MKYISYRKDRGIYVFSYRKKGIVEKKYFHTKAEAIQYRYAFYVMNHLDLSELAEDNSIEVGAVPENFEQLINKYLDWVYANKAVGTYNNYLQSSKVIIKKLGKYELRQITETRLEEFFNEINRKKKSKNYNSSLLQLIRLSLNVALKNHWITNNPAKALKPAGEDSEKRLPFSDEELIKLLDVAKRHDTAQQEEGYQSNYYIIFKMYAQTGLRRNELLGLQCKDVVVRNGILMINIKEALKYDLKAKQTKLDDTKTDDSVRSIPIIDEEIAQFLRSRMKQKGFLFTNDGKNVLERNYIPISTLTGHFSRYRTEAGINPKLTIHSFRHYFASKLAMKNINIKTAQALGGWKTSRTMLDTYTHSNDKANSDALNKVFGLSAIMENGTLDMVPKMVVQNEKSVLQNVKSVPQENSLVPQKSKNDKVVLSTKTIDISNIQDVHEKNTKEVL